MKAIILRPLVRVPQRDWDNGDCGLACVAMITGESYEDVLAQFRKLPGKAETFNFQTYHRDLEAMLHSGQFRISTKRVKFISMRSIHGHAIVKVNVQKRGSWHWIVVDGGRRHPVIHDPRPGKRSLITDFRGLKGSGYYISCSI